MTISGQISHNHPVNYPPFTFCKLEDIRYFCNTLNTAGAHVPQKTYSLGYGATRQKAYVVNILRSQMDGSVSVNTRKNT